MLAIPFSGSKRFFYNDVKEIVKAGNYKRVYEPFGGSCVLSVNLKNDGLAECVANDYDHFFDLYPKYLDYKDLVVEECYKRGLRKVKEDKEGYYFLNDDNKKVRLTQNTLYPEQRKILQDVISENVPEEYWRLFCYGTNFAWSVVRTHEKIRLCDFCMFYADLTTTKQRTYIKALREIKLEHLDYRRFLEIYKWEIQDDPETLLILDPPYIGTEQRQYKGGFSISQTRELLEEVKSLNCDFIFFTHDSQNLDELFPDDNFQKIEYGCTNHGNRKRKDVMVYVRRDT